MYAYFLADILMLSLFFLSLATLFAALRKMSRPYFLASVSLGSLAVFTHPWTFDQYFVAVVGGTLLLYIINFREEGSIRIKWLVVYCLILAGTDVFKFIIFRGSVEGFAALGLVSGFLTSVSTFRVDLVNVSMFYLNGYLTNMPLLTLAVLGLARAKARTVSNLIFWVLLVTTFSAYLIGDVIVKSRLLYNIPIGLFAALGLSYIDDLVLDKRLRTMIKVVVVVLLLSYLFRDLANLV
jgi:hypothetical protein